MRKTDSRLFRHGAQWLASAGNARALETGSRYPRAGSLPFLFGFFGADLGGDFLRVASRGGVVCGVSNGHRLRNGAPIQTARLSTLNPQLSTISAPPLPAPASSSSPPPP